MIQIIKYDEFIMRIVIRDTKSITSSSCSDADMQAAAVKSDATASKRAYVELVAALQSWSAAENLVSKIKGLN